MVQMFDRVQEKKTNKIVKCDRREATSSVAARFQRELRLMLLTLSMLLLVVSLAEAAGRTQYHEQVSCIIYLMAGFWLTCCAWPVGCLTDFARLATGIGRTISQHRSQRLTARFDTIPDMMILMIFELSRFC